MALNTGNSTQVLQSLSLKSTRAHTREPFQVIFYCIIKNNKGNENVITMILLQQ